MIVSKGFQHVHETDYDETFSLVMNMDSISLALSIVASKEFHQMDVKNSFLHGDLFEEVYMDKPQGFVQDSYLVFQLNNSIYGLK
jgi:hypothetical protein